MSAIADLRAADTACVLVEGLTRHHGGVLANDGISLAVGTGEVFGVLGPNGAGKTTLVRQLVGLLRPDAGAITLAGAALDRRRAGRLIAYLPQDDSALADLPVGLAVETTARLRGVPARQARDQRDAILAELGLSAVAGRPLVHLSGGQRRLAGVAAALAGERPVLILDEPTTGLDPYARRSVWAALARRRAERAATVILVTHNVLEAETVLDRVAVLDGGRLIACDTPGRLKALVSEDVRLELVWREDAPVGDRLVSALRARAVISGRRWNVRLPAADAREALAWMTSGPVFAALDDFTVSTPSLEDVYLALGGRDRGWEHQ